MHLVGLPKRGLIVLQIVSLSPLGQPASLFNHYLLFPGMQRDFFSEK